MCTLACSMSGSYSLSFLSSFVCATCLLIHVATLTSTVLLRFEAPKHLLFSCLASGTCFFCRFLAWSASCHWTASIVRKCGASCVSDPSCDGCCVLRSRVRMPPGCLIDTFVLYTSSYTSVLSRASASLHLLVSALYEWVHSARLLFCLSCVSCLIAPASRCSNLS